MNSFKALMIAIFAIIGIPAFSQDSPAKKDTAHTETLYYCPMHPDVVTDEPGMCPECNMELREKPKEAAKQYTCTTHKEVVSDKPGKCPKCQKELTEIKKPYICPMHSDVTSDKPGKCPKCGMTLVEKKTPPAGKQ